jgi:hypothetical protein
VIREDVLPNIYLPKKKWLEQERWGRRGSSMEPKADGCDVAETVEGGRSPLPVWEGLNFF